MEELIECLKKYDKDHKNFHETHKEEIISKLLKAFGNPTNIKYTCTEDPQVYGTSRRVDAYVDTSANKYALEVKLSLTTGASLGRDLFSKVKQTLERFRVNAIHNYSFAPENAIPLWYRPWIRQITRDLYRLPPPGLRRLVGLHGVRRIIRNVAPELRKYLERYYIVRLKPHENAMQLIPRASSPSTQSRRNAIAGLKNILTEAMRETASKGAQRIIQEKGYIDWQEIHRDTRGRTKTKVDMKPHKARTMEPQAHPLLRSLCLRRGPGNITREFLIRNAVIGQ